MTTKRLHKAFPITSICRADLQEYFTDKEIESLDNVDMEYLASKMADAYCDNGFWIDMEIIARDILNDK